jgi:hypothetical protein
MGQLLGRNSMLHRLAIFAVATFFISFCHHAHAAAGCQQPTSGSVIAFTAFKCDGKPGFEFNAFNASGATVVEGMLACRELEGMWRTYCSCMNQPLVAQPARDARDIVFKILNCRNKPNMQVHCGNFSCGPQSSSSSSSSSGSSSSSLPVFRGR